MNISAIIAVFLLSMTSRIKAGDQSPERLESPGFSSNSTMVHSRQKRYIVFPKGASLQILLEVLSHVPTRYKLFVGPTLQIAWPLPSEPSFHLEEPSSLTFSSGTTTSEDTWKRKYKIFSNLAEAFNLFGMTVGLAWQLPDDPKIYSEFKRKHKIYKRNAIKKIEAFMKPNGADGRECVLRALCESGQRTPSKKKFLTEILHKIFSYNDDEEETQEDKIYKKAHESTNQNCELLYPNCNFSIFQAVQ